MADEAPGRKNFLGCAPELRAQLVAELSSVIAASKELSSEESAILRHTLAYAGLGEDGLLRIPSFAALWGEDATYVPPVSLSPERARAVAKVLRRRGLLVETGHGVVLNEAAVRALNGPKPG